jgi:hypothetical protein
LNQKFLISHRDTLGLKPPRFYDRHTRKFELGESLPSRHFDSVADAEAVRPLAVGQVHSGLITIVPFVGR